MQEGHVPQLNPEIPSSHRDFPEDEQGRVYEPGPPVSEDQGHVSSKSQAARAEAAWKRRRMGAREQEPDPTDSSVHNLGPEEDDFKLRGNSETHAESMDRFLAGEDLCEDEEFPLADETLPPTARKCPRALRKIVHRAH